MPQDGRVRLRTRLRRALRGSAAAATTVVGPLPGRTLPDWFALNRVHGQTRLPLGPKWHRRREFKEAAAGFKELGARVFTRHVKTSNEDPPWPTALPEGPDGVPLSARDRVIRGVPIEQGRSVAKEIIDEARNEGMRIMGYYWPMTEESVANLTRLDSDSELDPDWVCRDPNGNPMPHEKRPGTHLDITSQPYRELVLSRLRELAAMGVDGFMFDERHLPPDGCWGSALEDAWREERGVDAPVEDTDPGYLQYLDFKARKIEDTFAYWQDAVKGEHPQVVFAVSTTSVPALTSREMTTRLVRIADSAKNEYRLALNRGQNKGVFEGDDAVDAPAEHVRQAIGWTVLRDSADGRPPRIWAPGLPDVWHAKAFAGSLLTFGCIAHMDVQEKSLLGRQDPDEGKTPLDGIRAAFELGDLVSPHFANTQVLRWAALHFSESIRNKRGANPHAAWREVLWPLVGAYEVLAQDGLPVGTVDDKQLERGELAGYRLLVLTNSDELSPGQQRAVNAFAAGGGAVVRNKASWAWSDPLRRPAAVAEFRAAASPHLGTAPVVVRGGPRNRYAVAYRGTNKLVVAVTNAFDWVQVTRPSNEDEDEVEGEVDPDESPGQVNPPAPDAEGVRIAWRIGHGLPETGPLTPFHRLVALEAVTGRRLPVTRQGGTFLVNLPSFPFMALLVVTRLPRIGPFPPGLRGAGERAPVAH